MESESELEQEILQFFKKLCTLSFQIFGRKKWIGLVTNYGLTSNGQLKKRF